MVFDDLVVDVCDCVVCSTGPMQNIFITSYTSTHLLKVPC